MNLTSEIVRALVAAQGNPVSGEAISASCGVSRMAVSKAVGKLREEGFDISSRNNVGYVLNSEPDRIHPASIAARSDNIFWNGISFQDHIDSTNDWALNAAKEGKPAPSAYIAARQTKGRGRLGRVWESPEGGAYISILVRPNCSVQSATSLSLVVALAVMNAYQAQGIDTQVKWPNDVSVNGSKAAGILLEMQGDVDGVAYVVAGIGLNIAPNPQVKATDLAAPPFFLAQHESFAKSPLAINSIIASVLEEFRVLYTQWQKEGFAPFAAEFSSHEQNLHKHVDIYNRLGDRMCSGVVEGVDADGCLLVESVNDEGEKITHHVSSGEVSLRPI